MTLEMLRLRCVLLLEVTALVTALLLVSASHAADAEDEAGDLLVRLLRALTKDKDKGKAQNVPAVKCSDEQFACKNKKECVHKNKVCNEQENCADGSDEENCKSYNCPSGMERCGTSRQCVMSKHKCDLNPDCANNFDEDNCKSTYKNPEFIEAFKCKSDEMACAKTGCVWKMFVCDGDKDCPDGSGADELNCPPKKKRPRVRTAEAGRGALRSLLKRLLDE